MWKPKVIPNYKGGDDIKSSQEYLDEHWPNVPLPMLWPPSTRNNQTQYLFGLPRIIDEEKDAYMFLSAHVRNPRLNIPAQEAILGDSQEIHEPYLAIARTKDDSQMVGSILSCPLLEVMEEPIHLYELNGIAATNTDSVQIRTKLFDLLIAHLAGSGCAAIIAAVFDEDSDFFRRLGFTMLDKGAPLVIRDVPGAAHAGISPNINQIPISDPSQSWAVFDMFDYR